MAQILARGTLLYLGTVNLGSVALFGYDKFQAQREEYRVSEKALCRSAWAGGWAGGLVAMQLFRHKTRKKSFQQKYVAAIGQNLVTMGLGLFLVTRSPHVRAAFGRELSNSPRNLGRIFRGGSSSSRGRGFRRR